MLGTFHDQSGYNVGVPTALPTPFATDNVLDKPWPTGQCNDDRCTGPQSENPPLSFLQNWQLLRLIHE